MSSDMVGSGNLVWIVDYNLATGAFTGTATRPGEPALAGTAQAASGIASDAPYLPGTQIELETGGLIGRTNGLTYSNGSIGAIGYARYEVEIFLESAPTDSLGVTYLIVHGAENCTELGGQTPRPR